MLGSYILGRPFLTCLTVRKSLGCVHVGFICSLPPVLCSRIDGFSCRPNRFLLNGKNNVSEWFFLPITAADIFLMTYICVLCNTKSVWTERSPSHNIHHEIFWVACKWQPVFHDLCITQLSLSHFCVFALFRLGGSDKNRRNFDLVLGCYHIFCTVWINSYCILRVSRVFHHYKMCLEWL